MIDFKLNVNKYVPVHKMCFLQKNLSSVCFYQTWLFKPYTEHMFCYLNAFCHLLLCLLLLVGMNIYHIFLVE